MLRTTTNQMGAINANQSISADSTIGGKTVANFSGSFSVGMMQNYSTSKSIADLELYNENSEAVDADYKAFEARVMAAMIKLKAAVDGIMQEQKESGAEGAE